MTSEFVGRESELEQLDRYMTTAIGGQGHVILTSGEASIGKTSLVECFLALAAGRHPQLSIAKGQCSERFGHGEAYLPFIKALAAGRARCAARALPTDPRATG